MNIDCRFDHQLLPTYLFIQLVGLNGHFLWLLKCMRVCEVKQYIMPLNLARSVTLVLTMVMGNNFFLIQRWFNYLSRYLLELK